MNKLVFAALLLGGLTQATGCIIVSDDDDETGYFNVSWNLTEGANDTTASTCPGDTVEVVSERVGGTQFVDLYDCVDGSGETAALPLGDYNVWVNVKQGDTLMAQSFLGTASIDLDGETVPIGFDIAIDGGYFGLTWSMTDDLADLTCGDVGAGGVSVLSTLIGPNTGIDDIFDCTDGSATTPKLDLGDYTIVVSLLDAVDDSVLGASMPRETSLDYGNELNDLGNFEFVFAP
jgi:hypothetical protein